jgi:FkbM family methyltransferase
LHATLSLVVLNKTLLSATLPNQIEDGRMKRAVNKFLGLAGLRLVRTSTALPINELQIRLSEVYEWASIARPYGQLVEFERRDLGMNLTGTNDIKPTDEAAYMLRTIRPGQTVIDVGANIGVLTLLMARAVGSKGRVYSFEPGPRSFQLLQNNILRNGYSNVVAENLAVGEREAVTELQVALSGESDNRLADVTATPGTFYCTEVRVVALDDYLKDRPVDFIKIDAQGSEFRILRGLRKTVSLNPAIRIIAEFSPHWLRAAGVSPDDWFSLIDDLGLKIENISESGEAILVTRDWLMNEVGGTDQPQVNVVLRRESSDLTTRP